MADVELVTASWSGFYDNDPWLNQENWQRYFANTVVDGTPSSDIYNGNWRGNLAPYLDSEGNLMIDTGICFAKGIAARFDTLGNVGNSMTDTKFISVIIDPETRTAKMMSQDVGSNAVTQLLANPRYFCQSDYEIPICYRDAGRVIDLRHFATDRNSRSNAGLESIVFQASTSPAVTQYPFGKAYGFEGTRNAFIRAYLGRTYTVTMENGASIDTLRIMPIPVCSSEPVTFTVYNDTANDVTIILSTDTSYYRNEYVWSTSWTAEINLDVEKTLASNSSMTFVLTPAGLDEHKVLYAISSPSTSEGGAIDPETIYTKSEVNSLLEDKADDTDVVSLQNAVEGKAESEDLAPVWESGEVYQAGDLVTHNSRLYRFLRSFTGFEWDSTVVESVTIAEHLNDEIAVKADADTVYTKSETDALISSQLATKADADSVYTKTETDSQMTAKANVSDLVLKADANAVYTKAEVDTQMNMKADVSDLNFKADRSSVYSKAEIDSQMTAKADTSVLAQKADASSVYSKVEIDSQMTAKADTANVYDKTQVYTKTEIDTALALLPSSTLYVDKTSGSDSNDGNTLQTAFKTIQRAVDMASAPVTRILITPNQYGESVEISGKKIIFAGTTNTEIRITSPVSNQYALKVLDGADVKFEGLFTFLASSKIIDISNATLNYKGLTTTDKFRVTCQGTSTGVGITVENGGVLSSNDVNSQIQIDTFGNDGNHDAAIYAVNSRVSITKMIAQSLQTNNSAVAIHAESSVVTCKTLEGNQTVESTSSYVNVNNNVVNDEYYKKDEIDARIYYVNAGSGSDNNDGRSLSTPFATIQKAVDSANSDSVIRIDNGTYREHVTIKRKNITLYDRNGNGVIIDSTNYENSYALEVESCNVCLHGNFTLICSEDGCIKANGATVVIEWPNSSPLFYNGSITLRTTGRFYEILNLENSNFHANCQLNFEYDISSENYSEHLIKMKCSELFAHSINFSASRRPRNIFSVEESYITVSDIPDYSWIEEGTIYPDSVVRLGNKVIDGSYRNTYYDKTQTEDLIDSKISDAITDMSSSVQVRYYVDLISGSDDNDGLTRETAFKTFQKAIDLCPPIRNSDIYVISNSPSYIESINPSIVVSNKTITFHDYFNNRIYTGAIKASHNGHIVFENDVYVTSHMTCIHAEYSSSVIFSPKEVLWVLPDPWGESRSVLTGLSTGGDGVYYSYSHPMVYAQYGSTVIIPGAVECHVKVGGNPLDQEDQGRGTAIQAWTGSKIYLGDVDIHGYTETTILRCDGSIITYGSLTKSGGTLKNVSNGGIIKTGSAG